MKNLNNGANLLYSNTLPPPPKNLAGDLQNLKQQVRSAGKKLFNGKLFDCKTFALFSKSNFAAMTVVLLFGLLLLACDLHDKENPKRNMQIPDNTIAAETEKLPLSSANVSNNDRFIGIWYAYKDTPMCDDPNKKVPIEKRLVFGKETIIYQDKQVPVIEMILIYKIDKNKLIWSHHKADLSQQDQIVINEYSFESPNVLIINGMRFVKEI